MWAESRVGGITLGSFPAHEIPQELFYCLQCLPLTGKGIHMAAWRTANGGDQYKTGNNHLFLFIMSNSKIVNESPTDTDKTCLCPYVFSFRGKETLHAL